MSRSASSRHSQFLKTLVVGALWLLAASASAVAFPSEEEMTARLRPGMSSEEVISAFGQPGSGPPRTSGPSTMRYIAPIGSMTREEEGYIGFEVQLVDGKVESWRTLIGNPSYAPMTAPPQFWWTLRFWGILFVGGFFYGLFRLLRKGMSEEQLILKAYKERYIPTPYLPEGFRFITNDTTLQEIIEKAGPYSRSLKFAVDETFTSGYEFVKGPLGMPSLVRYEWDLPYRATVIVLPEYPFEPANRIRAAFYRRPRPDEEP